MIITKNQKLIHYYLELYHFSDVLDKNLIRQMLLFEFKPGEYIAKSDEMPDYLFFYVKGKSKVYQSLENGKSLLCRFYNPPEIVGDVEIFSDKPNICNLQALSAVICIGIPVDMIRKEAEKNNRLLIMLCRSLGSKLANFNIISAINQNYPLENRLASYLTAVSEPGKSGESMIQEIHTNNLTELADLLGTSYRHLTRTIRKFKDLDMITKYNNEYHIKNRDKLMELAKDIYL